MRSKDRRNRIDPIPTDFSANGLANRSSRIVSAQIPLIRLLIFKTDEEVISGQALRKLQNLTNDTGESGRKQELKKKEWNGIGTKQVVWFTVQECIRFRLKKC
ncbi:hypothetical protein TNCV_2643781 [Trichonephila clavipes]|nr:hypothetical protein TNCV_2643781 [Trichonephila clavipes]